MLAGRERPQRPLLVEAVHERDVDRVDLGVFEQCLVALRAARNRMLSGHLLCPRRIAAGDRDEASIVGAGDGGDECFARDRRRAHDPPADPVSTYIWTSRRAPPRAIDSVAASMTATVRRASLGVTASFSSHARWSARLR